MYLTKCVSSFAEVAAQGPELAFVVYPEGKAPDKSVSSNFNKFQLSIVDFERYQSDGCIGARF